MIEIDGFINLDYLDEKDEDIEDSLDLSEERKKIFQRLKGLSKSCIYGLVGAWGSGKSTLLNNIKSQDNIDNKKWLVFDAWSVSDRQALWDGLILQFLKEYEIKKLKKYKSKTVGGIYNGKDFLVLLLQFSILFILFLLFLGILNFSKNSFLENYSWFVRFSNLIKYVPLSNSEVIGFIFSGLILSLFLPIYLNNFKSNPYSRTNEFRDEFKKILKNIPKKYGEIYVVLEDIDRCGDEGIYFLETLKQFINNELKEETEIENKFIFIVPMAKPKLEDRFKSYIKCIDYYDFFEPDYKFEEFIEKAFPKLNKENQKIKSGIVKLFNKLTKQNHSLRDLKYMIRKINEDYKKMDSKYDNVDWRIYLACQFTKQKKKDKCLGNNNLNERIIISATNNSGILYKNGIIPDRDEYIKILILLIFDILKEKDGYKYKINNFDKFELINQKEPKKLESYLEVNKDGKGVVKISKQYFE